MSDRYAAGSYYEQLHPAQAQAQAAMSHYGPSYQRSGFGGSSSYNPYAGYGYGGGGGGGGASGAGSAYMPNYYRYAPYASPHYSQHAGMFTPAGQQLIPSSVLHYPPRPQAHPHSQSHYPPQHHPHAHNHHSYPQHAPHSHYEPPAPALYSASSYGQSRGFAAYQSTSSHYATPGRSSTPAPNRTVLPPNYLPSYAEQSTPVTTKLEDVPPEQLKLEHELEAASPAQRLTTSPPLTSATGTDSGISNCSTRARSDSSQSTPVYSGEYPVNMSVESASCVSYHCPADGYEEEQQPQPQQQQQPPLETGTELETEEQRAGATAATLLDSNDDISATAVASTSPSTAAAVNDIDKAATETAPVAEVGGAAEGGAPATAEGGEEQPEVVRRAEINLTQTNNKESTTGAGAGDGTEAGTGTKLAPQDIAEQSATNQINDDAAEQTQPSATAAAATTSHNWSPKPRRPRTPPAPQNSPVGYGLNTSAAAPPTVPPALAPLVSISSKRHAKNRNNNNNNSGNNRIIECDLIPSKKSKRKNSKKEAESEQVDATEPTVREQIRDIKPLPGFLQAFGSTEIGRFSERFLQTPESLVERLAEEYASSTGHHSGSNTPSGYYDAPTSANMHGYWPYEEQQQNMAYYQSQQMSRNYRMRNQGQNYGYQDYAAYERYGYAAYNAARSRYGEIRCNGY